MFLYTLIQRVNPRDVLAPRKYYAHAEYKGNEDLRSVANQIAKQSTVSPGDTLAVLETLMSVMTDFLLDGKIVHLGDFGSFRGSISSDGAETSEDWDQSLIKKMRIRFRPGKVFSHHMDAVEFQKTTEREVVV